MTVAAGTGARRLSGLLRALPPEQRYAIALAFFGELTYSQIADHIGVPLGIVKSRIRLGLPRLRHELRDLEPSPTGNQPLRMPAG